MAVSSATSATFGKRALQTSLLHKRLLSQLGFSQNLAPGDSLGGFIRSLRARLASGTDISKRARNDTSNGFEMHSAAQRQTSANNSGSRLAPIKLRSSFTGSPRRNSSLIFRQLSTLNESSASSVVAVGMSGCVDSSIAALLLQRQVTTMDLSLLQCCEICNVIKGLGFMCL
jgi:hypothetical protein